MKRRVSGGHDTMTSAIECAEFLTTYAYEHGHAISNLDLQKILYLSEKASIDKNGMPMLDEPFYAWQYGPVIPSVYNRYAPAGGEPIAKQYGAPVTNGYFISDHPTEAHHMIDILDKYAGRHFDLVRDVMSDADWLATYDGGRGYGLTIEKVVRH